MSDFDDGIAPWLVDQLAHKSHDLHALSDRNRMDSARQLE